eukprot:XP_001705508.1 Hypothetical protein GL50803_115310 [Giardia lamblia ATCC 50803]
MKIGLDPLSYFARLFKHSILTKDYKNIQELDCYKSRHVNTLVLFIHGPCALLSDL